MKKDKFDFTIPEEILDKIKIGRWYKISGWYAAGERMTWNAEELDQDD